MELEIRMNNESLTLVIDDPFRPDVDGVTGRISAFAAGQGVTLNGLDVRGLLPEMIRGVVGCEEGCPADAKELVERGYRSFALEYIEGGILTASARTAGGTPLVLKLFPDF
jgi:hypothetical protein